MELRQIRYFITAAETKSISKAAKALSVSQPTLSVALKKLEEDIGAKLIIREGKGFELSQAGEAFLKKAIPAVRALETAKDDARRLSGKRAYTVAFAVISINTHWELVSSLAGTDAEIRFLPAVNQTYEKMAENLVSRRYDICISAPPVSGPGLITKMIHNKDIYAMVPENHPLAGRESILLSELAYEEFALPQENTPYYGRNVELCRLAGFVPNVGYSYVSLGDAYMAVQKGGFVSLIGLPEDGPDELLHNVSAIKVSYPDCRATLGATWREEDNNDERLAKIIETIAEHFARRHEMEVRAFRSRKPGAAEDE